MADANLYAQRREAVDNALRIMRAAVGTASTLEASVARIVEEQILGLAQRSELWDLKDFPIQAGQRWGVWEVSEDADGRFAVYASAAHPGHAQPPHNHTTWACIAGVSGTEVNRFYQRIEGDGTPGPARLLQSGQRDIGKGAVVLLGPDDIHDIEIVGPSDAMHLHVYGLGFSHLHRRMRYDMSDARCEYFPVFTDIPKL
jgi:hypothetical protein